MSIDRNMVTTALELPGFKVATSLGIVRGIIVRSRSIVGNFGASIQALFGGNITLYTNLCEQARLDAYNHMTDEANRLGADGIIGMRYDATEIAPGMTEVICYGTAVKLVRAG